MAKIDEIVSSLGSKIAELEHRDSINVTMRIDEVLKYLNPLYVYAKGTERTITYKDGLTTLTGLVPTFYVEGTLAVLPTNATKTHYTFEGWYEDSSFTGDKVLVIPTSATGNKTFYAKFVGVSLTVTKDEISTIITCDATATYGTAFTATVKPNPTYTLANDVTVKVGSTTLTKDTDYTYTITGSGDEAVGTLSINADKVTDNIVITASATGPEPDIDPSE